jgi:hypothetical protein
MIDTCGRTSPREITVWANTRLSTGAVIHDGVGGAAWDAA